MILYFSGTGNSRYIAQRMARTVGGEAVSLNGLLRDGGPVDLAAGEGALFTVCYGFSGLFSGALKRQGRLLFLLLFLSANTLAVFWSWESRRCIGARIR